MNWRRLALLASLLIVVVIGGVWLFGSQLGVNPPLPKVLTLSSASTTHLVPPKDYRVSIFADELNAPRLMRVIPAGLLVSLPHEGKVVLLRDENNDGVADDRQVVLENLNQPHGLDVYDGWLFVAETDAVGRAPFDSDAGVVTGRYQHILPGLPSGAGHWTRTVSVGPDGWLYVTVGSSCNVCLETAPERATMLRVRPDGSEMAIFAAGLRNSVDFDWSPLTGELYATDNGRDWLGDDFPPDELNRVVRGGFYGWPYANGAKTPDPDFGEGQQKRISESLSPAFEFRAHNAPLGFRFLRHQQSEYQYSALVALHGSWNRSVKDGYKVVSLHWQDDGEVVARDFLTGFLSDDKVHGRPVGIAEAADGSVFVSDDYAGMIYRLSVEK